MPMIAEIKTEGKDIWCRIELPHKAELPITLWTLDEIKQHDRQLLVAFAIDLIDKYLESR